MVGRFDLADFTAIGCDATRLGSREMVVRFPLGSGRLVIDCETGNPGGLAWGGYKYIVCDAINEGDYVLPLLFELGEESGPEAVPDLTVFMGLLPNMKTRLSLPLSVLSLEKLFLDRTPGKLKTVVWGRRGGRRIDVEKIRRFALGAKDFVYDHKVRILGLYLSDEEPDYPLPDTKFVDELGQLCTKDWPGKTHGVRELVSYLKSESTETSKPTVESKSAEAVSSWPKEWSSYGGSMHRRFAASGYFRTEHDGSRWWLVDPDGYPFFSCGVDCVSPGEPGRVDGITKLFQWLPDRDGEFRDAWSSRHSGRLGDYYTFAISNLIRVFGQDWRTGWTELTRRRLKDWGVNTIGNWSSPEFIKALGLPYVWPLQGFPTTEKVIFRDFPDVFSPEYEANAQAFAEQARTFAGDRNLIGYFLRNEPQWAFIHDLVIAEKVLEDDCQTASKDALVAYLSHLYSGDIGRLNEAWKSSFSCFDDLRKGIKQAASLSDVANRDLREFSRQMVRRYVEVPSKALKAVDPDHMNLGMRYAFISSEDLIAGCESFDVFSINCYDLSPRSVLDRVGAMTNLPVMIGEFHFGALDRGLLSTGLRGVANQEERGKAYRYYVESAAANPNCVGAHYFILNDQAVLGRFDGENFQIGIVDVCHRPYEGFVEELRDTNRRIYEVASGTRRATGTRPVEIKGNGS